MDGVGLFDFEVEEGWELFRELTGGKRDGTVPARVRRVVFVAGDVVVLTVLAFAGLASKSGKLSLPGDSGMVSRKGVE